MDVYMYQAALLCNECGLKVRERLSNSTRKPADPNDESSYDSDDYPKGPYADGGGESDLLNHCDYCDVSLENHVIPGGW